MGNNCCGKGDDGRSNLYTRSLNQPLFNFNTNTIGQGVNQNRMARNSTSNRKKDKDGNMKPIPSSDSTRENTDNIKDDASEFS